MRIIDTEIKNALIAKGYTWNDISIKSYLGYTHLYGCYLDGRLREVYNTTRRAFVD